MTWNPIVFALRHPVTVMVGIAALVGGGVLAATRMKVDIFPSLNLPVVYVAQPYGGMDPGQMEGLITNYYEYHFLYISGIHHVESRNIQGAALMKLYFHPETNMAQALAETVGYVNRSRAFMPPGTVPPFIMRFDTGSVPVGYLVLRSDTKTIGEIQDQALFKVRPMFASLPGVSAPPPFGGNQRTIVVRTDPDRLRAYNLSPEEVIQAVASGNLVSPSGNIRVKDQMPIVPIDAMVVNPADLGNIPIRPGSDVYLRDLGTIEDSTDIPVGYALVNGSRAVYILVTKRAEASTLSVVGEVKRNLAKMQASIPEDIKVAFEFDQSPYVTRAMWGVAIEGLLGAVLTGLMVWLFLRDWRSVIVVVLNIPFALLGSLVALWLSGQTINLMTLGGLALAVGILVDEATVEVENIHTQFEHTPSIARAVRRGNQETAVPRLLAMLCILAVFIPSFFMEGAARALFVPLSLAVGFAMVTSYVLSSTFVPVLSVWLLRHVRPPEAAAGSRASSGRMRDGYLRLVRGAVQGRAWLAPAYLLLAAVLIWLVGGQVGREIFPTVDTGQFQLRLRAATGTRIEITEQLAVQALEAIKQKAGPDNVSISLGYIGLIGSSYPINTVYLWTSGPEEAVLRVALKPHSGINTKRLQEELRRELPGRLAQWLRGRLAEEDLPPAAIAQRIRGLRLSFEPADIVNEVMSFGSPTPVEVAVSGPKLAESRAYAETVKRELAKIPSLRDLQYVQPMDYPAVEVKVDRELVGTSGIATESVAKSLVAATSSSRFVVPNYWRDPNTGIGYQVQVEILTSRMNAPREVGLVPIKRPAQTGQLLLQDVARIREGVVPGEYDRYNMKRVVSMTANVEGEDLGRVAAHIADALRAAGEPPRGVAVDVRGQIVPMQQMFGALAGGKVLQGLTAGLLLAVVVIFLLLTAYFQSWRLALVVVLTAPAVLAGVAVGLLVTSTTLNLQSFMGAIMAVGVAVANAILLVTFAERSRAVGATAADAAVDAAQHRLRPILMTSCAMIAGMLPLALALGEGGDQTAPLGRAVIGGLLAATLCTLLVLPALFAMIQGRASVASPSLDPDDPDSHHFDEAPPAGPRLPGPIVAGAALLMLVAGCGQPPATSRPQASPAVKQAISSELRIVKPLRKTVRRAIEQPGFNIEAYQQTPLYSKINGYIEKWNVDIGDSVAKDQLLAELYVPEMAADLEQKEAALRQAVAQIAQARAAVSTAQAQIERAKSQFERLQRASRDGVLDRENVDEARLGHEASKAVLEKARADVAVAEAQSAAAKASRDYAKAMLAYAEIRAPYDGVVTQRSVNAGDFVQPAASGAKGLPLFVINQIDPVRVFVQIPGVDAAWIQNGDPVTLRVQGAEGDAIEGRVTRNARSLNPESRTLRTEIDLPNPKGQLLPGMYVQATIHVQHADVWTLPAEAVIAAGNQTLCYRLVAGRAVRTPLEVGLRGGGLVEVVKMQLHPSGAEESGAWQPIGGGEQVLVGNLAALSDGQTLQAGPTTKPGRPK